MSTLISTYKGSLITVKARQFLSGISIYMQYFFAKIPALQHVRKIFICFLLINFFNNTEAQKTKADQTPPTVVSINRQSPTVQSTNATSVTFRVTFSEKVTGVDYTDFTLTILSGNANGIISTSAVTSVGNGTIYSVTVSSITGSGTLRLDLKAANTGITDIAGNAIASGYTSGQTYIIDNTAPTVVSINRQVPLTQNINATSVIFRIVFSEAVTGVDVTDFVATTVSGSLTSSVTGVTAVGTTGDTYDVTIGSITGEGTLRLDLNSTGTGITDIATNAISGGYTGGQTYTIQAADLTTPAVISINRQQPTASVTSATSVIYRVTFSEKVNGVDASDFTVTRVSGTVNGIIASNGVGAVGTTGDTYDVTISSITGGGTLRLDLNSTGTSITDTATNAISGGYTSGQTYTIEHSGFASVTNINSLAISAKTGEKPQAKVWEYDGKNWCVLPNSSGTYLWRLDGTTWTNILRLSTKTTSKADCRLVGNIAHILLYQGASSQMVSVEYVPSSTTYKLWSKRTSTVGLTLDTGVETASIDIDGNGRMWLASAGVADINLRWSDAPYSTWSSPITIATGVNDDDICAVIYMPTAGKIGVLWSNQNTQRFGFKTHTDGTSPGVWSTDEIPASQSALNVGAGMADDHVNMAVAGDGTLYCAVKTSYDKTGYPKIALLKRSPQGIWDNLYEVSQNGTRPIVLLNETLSKLRIIYASVEFGGDILYQESSTSNVSFSPPITLIKGGTYDDPTSTHQNLNSNLVILASDATNAVGVIASDGIQPTLPNVPLLSSPADASTVTDKSPILSWNISVNTSSYEVQVSTGPNFSTTVFDQGTITNTSPPVTGLSNNTVYYWRVKAINEAGSSNWSTVWSFTTTSTAPSGSLIANWKMDEGGGTTLIDSSEYQNNATTVGNPVWIAGKVGQALQLNGTSQYATAPNNASLNITGAVTLAAWIKPEKVATQYIIKKAVNGSTNGYELSLSNAGQVFFRFNQASSGDTYRLNSVASYPTDGVTWMYIAATYDGTIIKIYLNGVENSSKTLISPPLINVNTLPLALGSQSDGTSKFQGVIDEARIYNTALSASEISNLATTAPAVLMMSSSSAKANVELAPPPTSTVELLHELSVYPNPSTSNATVSFSLPTGGYYSITLYDIKGSKIKVLKKGKALERQMNRINLDCSYLAKGTYLIRLHTHQNIKTLKLVVSK